MAAKKEIETKQWSSPELVRLGKLADVGPGNPGIGEGGSGKS